MQSLGNDFVVLDGVNQQVQMTQSIATALADRHYGVGCDQILMAEPGRDDVDFVLRIFNQDGSEVGQCGNGARCFGRFVFDKGLIKSDNLKVRTTTSEMHITLHADESVSVDMGKPRFATHEVPLAEQDYAEIYSLSTVSGTTEFSAVSMGNPHAVILVDQTEQAPVESLGREYQQHECFPESVNVGFMAIRSRSSIDLRVFERGVGETLGCGSGACAAVVAGIRRGLLDASVTVNLPGGQAQVDWSGDHAPVILRGSAVTVFEGQIRLPA